MEKNWYTVLKSLVSGVVMYRQYRVDDEYLVKKVVQVEIYMAKETGRVKWFNDQKGFGFIAREQGEDVFVHHRAINASGRRTLHEGQRVEFNVVKGDKGFQAEDVTIVEE